jgi:hypothetical protein
VRADAARASEFPPRTPRPDAPIRSLSFGSSTDRHDRHSASGDGLSRAEAHCRDRLVNESSRFTETLARCFSSCEAELRRQDGDLDACRAANRDTPLFDPGTQRCVDRARNALRRGCEQSCANPPDCFGLTCQDVVESFEGQELSFEPQTYCED